MAQRPQASKHIQEAAKTGVFLDPEGEPAEADPAEEPAEEAQPLAAESESAGESEDAPAE